jgi:hypothetical protein
MVDKADKVWRNVHFTSTPFRPKCINPGTNLVKGQEILTEVFPLSVQAGSWIVT